MSVRFPRVVDDFNGRKQDLHNLYGQIIFFRNKDLRRHRRWKMSGMDHFVDTLMNESIDK